MAKGKKPAQMSGGKNGRGAKRTTGGPVSPLHAIWEGIGNLIDIVADMEETGVDEFVRKRTVEGKTASGKDVRGEYSFRVRTGLDIIREKRKKEKGEDKKGEK